MQFRNTLNAPRYQHDELVFHLSVSEWVRKAPFLTAFVVEKSLGGTQHHPVVQRNPNLDLACIGQTLID